ncbi:MAG TPA: hypothetical protein VLX56_09735 [Nitrososphaerales archaeon]|nr:hypothetical protein [Nitrososphaerales archaeon]
MARISFFVYGVIVLVIAILGFAFGGLKLSDYLSVASLAVVLLLAFVVELNFDETNKKLDELLEEKRKRDNEGM